MLILEPVKNRGSESSKPLFRTTELTGFDLVVQAIPFQVHDYKGPGLVVLGTVPAFSAEQRKPSGG